MLEEFLLICLLLENYNITYGLTMDLYLFNMNYFVCKTYPSSKYRNIIILEIIIIKKKKRLFFPFKRIISGLRFRFLHVHSNIPNY